MKINTAIDVVESFRSGVRSQEPGDRHWVRDGFDNVTACGVSSIGMVTDKTDHERVTCAHCAAALINTAEILAWFTQDLQLPGNAKLVSVRMDPQDASKVVVDMKVPSPLFQAVFEIDVEKK